MADGAVYVLDDLSALAAIDASTGERRWTLRNDSTIESSPVAGTGVVYFADMTGYLTAVDATTGEVRWKWRARRSKTRMKTNMSTPAAAATSCTPHTTAGCGRWTGSPAGRCGTSGWRTIAHS